MMSNKYILPKGLEDEEKERLLKNFFYWDADRMAAAQERRTTKNIKAVEAQLKKYYFRSMSRVIKDFEITYLKLQKGFEDGINPTPADLYKLDKYWEMQGQLRKELQKLGDKQLVALSDMFIKQYQEIYEAAALIDVTGSFSAVSKETAEQMINQIWCADGLGWSARVWKNTDKLQQALNDGLIECVVNGRSSEFLKRMLQDQFNTSYNNADSLVKTELSHIQTQAARQRYTDMGVKEVEVWAEKDERQCKICGKLHTKRYPVGAVMPIPAHPRCRCTIIPVIE